MTKHELIDILDRLGIRPSRRLGQNFLLDKNLLDAMVRDANPQCGEAILEIGPGTGVLTEKLLAAGAEVTAIEYDRRLYEFLVDRFGDCPSLHLMHADACDVDFDQVMAGRVFRCIANLPYSVSSVLVAQFLDVRHPPAELYVLLQREMADRLSATPGNKDYGALTVKVQLLYNVRVLRRIPPDVFYPPPAVASAQVRLQLLPEGDRLDPGLFAHVRRLVDVAFSQRRKRTGKLLASLFPVDCVREAFAALDIDPDVRAESLSPAQFVALARVLHSL